MADITNHCPNCEKLARENEKLRKLLHGGPLIASRQIHFLANHNGRFANCESAACKQARKALEVK